MMPNLKKITGEGESERAHDAQSQEKTVEAKEAPPPAPMKKHQAQKTRPAHFARQVPEQTSILIH
jgi:hypothetical protein